MDDRPLLMTVPNVSEGRDLATLEAIGRAFAPARFLDLHSDPDHDRAVFTLAARQGEMAQALLSGARSAVARIDTIELAIDPSQLHPFDRESGRALEWREQTAAAN